MTGEAPITVVMAFRTDRSPIGASGDVEISGPVDVLGLLTAVEAPGGGAMFSTYRDPAIEASVVADAFDMAAEQFRRVGGGW